MRQGKLIVVSGPSGVGKSVICKQVLAKTDAKYSVSATTRKPRPGEINGKDYHFVSRAEFEKMIAENKLLEWAEVFGNYYGSPALPVEHAIDAGENIILEIDVQGGIQVHKIKPDATFILVVPPSEEALAARLKGRGTENKESFDKRFGKSQKELQMARESGAYNIELVNDVLEKAIDELCEIVKK